MVFQPILRLQLRLYTDAGGVGAPLWCMGTAFPPGEEYMEMRPTLAYVALPGVMTSRPPAQKWCGRLAYLNIYNMYPNMIRRRREEKMGMGRRVSCPHFFGVRGHPKGKRRPPDGAQ